MKICIYLKKKIYMYLLFLFIYLLIYLFIYLFVLAEVQNTRLDLIKEQCRNVMDG